MKKTFAALGLCCALMAFSPMATAQKFVPAPVEISKDRVRIDGKVYYEHHVTEKQTLYSICKTYGADLQEVKDINKDQLENGLKVGAVLLIPYGGVKEESAPRQNQSRDYEDDGSDIKGTPVTRQQENTNTDGGTGYILHRVKWYDSLLMLALKYKVSQEEIIELNNLESRTLVVGDTIKIPVGNVALEDIDDNSIVDVPEDGQQGGYDPEAPVIDISEPDEPVEEEPVFVPFSGTANVALMLPIAASSGSPSGNFLDFYAGVLMALGEIKTTGVNVNLKVIDMADFDSAEQLIAASNLKGLDFIIGNFSPNNIAPLANWCDAHRIPFISPLDQKVEEVTYDHPYLVNVQLSAATQAMRLAESLRYKARRDNVIVLCEPGDNPGQFHQEVVSSLDSLKIPYTIVRAGAGRGAAIKDHLIQGRNNHVIITTEKESIAADAVRSTGMLAQSGNYNITGYASHRIRRFESIDQELLQRMNAHFSMGYYVDYNDEAVKEFVRSYRALYNAEPGNFAFQGHDIAYYFIKALQKYGSDMINGIDSYKEQLLQLSFDFDRRTGEGGMFNEATRNVVYASGGISLRK